MSNDRWQFGSSIAHHYDRYLVPIQFDAYAADLTRRVVRDSEGEVLELACGTGALSLRLREALPATRALLATDLSEAMLAIGREKRPSDSKLQWAVADASALPYPAARFGAVVCQFGMMFVPRPERALAEMKRVCRSGGLVLFNVWDALEHNPHAQIFARVASRFLPDPELLTDMDRPFSMHHQDRLAALVQQSGLGPCTLEVVVQESAASSALDWARGAVLGTPRGAQFRAAGIPVEEVITAMAEELAAAGGTDPCCLPLQAIVITARA
jgi:SAM-dependent methyltransferase